MTVMMIRQTAKEMAASDWDSGEHSERFRRFWPDVKQFQARNWPTYVPAARLMLIELLRRKSTPEHQKKQIFEALQEDHARSQAAPNTKVGVGRLNLNPEHPGAIERKLFH